MYEITSNIVVCSPSLWTALYQPLKLFRMIPVQLDLTSYFARYSFTRPLREKPQLAAAMVVEYWTASVKGSIFLIQLGL